MKYELHYAISKLGGTFMRNYDPRYVTHLIMDEAIGKKYESWKKNWKKKWVCSNIQIVKTSWVHACSEMGRRVPEKD